jgi:actin-like ATPase involved in cell morphogenesis
MTSAAIDLGATCLRVAYRGPDGVEVVHAADGADAVRAAVWMAGPEDARAGQAAAAGPPDEIITSVRADLLADPRATAPDRYFHGHFQSPEAVAGYLLAEAARRAGVASGMPVRDVMLGVPACVEDGGAISRAATVAGLRVADTTAEPLAVALHYGAVRDGVDHVTVVHDLGGTTLDVTVLRISGRNVAILRSARHPIGGTSWDEVLAGQLLAEAGVGGTPGPDACRVAEQLRVQLSDREQATGRLTEPGIERDVRFDRARLEEVTAHLLSRVVEITRETIEDAVRAGGERPDTVMLAGGANRMPMIGRALAERLGLDVRASEPQLAVVRGLMLARDFGLLFLTGQDGDPLTMPRARPTRPRQHPEAPVSSQEAQVIGPEQQTADSEPLAADPEPAASDPEPRLSDPEPAAADPEPAASDPEPRLSDPEPVTPVRPDSSRAAPTQATPRRTAPLPPPRPPQPPSAPQVARPRTNDADRDRPAQRAGPPGVVPVGGPPEAERMSGCPVEHLRALRRGDRLLLTWIWPDDSVESEVRWWSEDDRPGLQGIARCSRRLFEHDGGFELPAGRARMTITVEALVYGDRLEAQPPSALVVEPPRPAVRYAPSVKKGRRKWTVTMTFTGDVDCSLPPVLVVLGTDSYMPASTRDGEVVHMVPRQTVAAGSPASVSFELPPQRGTRWLVCLPADADTDAGVDLRPASLHRLQVN